MRKSLKLTLCLICLSIILSTPTGVMAGKPTPPPPPLMLYDVNIVTAEPDGDGRLRVWGYTGNGYENIWSAESVHYSSVAIGDADNDGTREIVGTTRSTVTEGKGKSRTSWYKIFFDVYKEGVSGVWLTSEWVREDRIYWMGEITIADVDATNPGNEVVMVTPHWLVIYKYTEGAFKIMSKHSFVEPSLTLFSRSITVGNIDGDSENEILVSANVEAGGEIVIDQGYLLIFQVSDATLSNVVSIFINAYMGDHSLHVGDLDGDGAMEICSPGYRKVGDLYQAYIFVWKLDISGSWKLVVDWPIGSPMSQWPWVHLDVGELRSDYVGEEIAVGTMDPDKLILYHLTIDGSYMLPIWEKTLGYYSVTISNVLVADSDGDGKNEIIASGSGRSDITSGCFYLEVFNGDSGSEWLRLGGERGEYGVWYAAVG